MRVRVMYGTQTGNSRGIANQLSDELKKASFDAPVAGLDQFKKLSLHEEDYVVIVCSTTGNGDAPENAEAFVRFVKNKKTAPGYFSKMSYSILGIGDTNYDQYQAIPRVIDLNLARLGAQRIIPKVETDEATGLEEVEPWIASLTGILTELRAAGVDAPKPPAEKEAEAPAVVVAAEAEAPALNVDAFEEEGEDVDAWAELEGGSALIPHAARLLEAEWLTCDEDGRRVMTLLLDISGCPGPALLGFKPGDALAVLPVNPQAEVRACLELLGIDSAAAAAPIRFEAGADVPLNLRGEPCAHLALSERVDLGSAAGWPRPPLLRLLAEHATAPAEAAELRAMLQGGKGARPSLSELLLRFRSSRPPLVKLLDALPPLAERYYSLASSPLQAQGSVRIVFTVLTYSVRDAEGNRVERRGLCSGVLADAGEELIASGGWVKPTVRVYRRRPTGNELRLPAQLSTPILMVGPGTGVAPFLAFLQHRRELVRAQAAKADGAKQAAGHSHLFFGCQHQVGDFLFADELEEMERDGTLTQLHTAFSRDARDSASAGEWRSCRLNVNYVQDLFIGASARIQQLLLKEGAYMYVCGDGSSMAADVHKELLAVLQVDCGKGAPASSGGEAEALLAKLAAAGRYAREIWYG